MHAVISSGEKLQLVHQRDQLILKLDPIADKTNTDASLEQLASLALDITAEQFHQTRNFGLGPLPVFGRERENRQVFDVILRAGFDDLSNTARTCVVPEKPRAAAHLRPPPVAIHDDRDMPRALVLAGFIQRRHFGPPAQCR